MWCSPGYTYYLIGKSNYNKPKDKEIIIVQNVLTLTITLPINITL
jgi:hypothetical protein